MSPVTRSSALRVPAADAAPIGVAAHPPRGASEDTDEIAADATPEFRHPAKTIIIVDICRRSENGTAQISNTYEIKDRKTLIRRLHEEIDVAVASSLVTRYRSVEKQLADAKRAELLAAIT